MGTAKAFWGAVGAAVVLTLVIGTLAGTSTGTNEAAPPPARAPQVSKPSSLVDDLFVQTANDQIEKYGIAQRSGSKMDACVQAGIVSAALLQAKDEARYAQWKRTERATCADAGVMMP